MAERDHGSVIEHMLSIQKILDSKDQIVGDVKESGELLPAWVDNSELDQPRVW